MVRIPKTLNNNTGYKEASADYLGASLHLSEISESKHIPVWYLIFRSNAKIVREKYLFFLFFKIRLDILADFIDFCEISDRGELQIRYS